MRSSTNALHHRLLVLACAQRAEYDIVLWSAALKDAIEGFVTGVDRVSININRGALLLEGPFTRGVASCVHAYDRRRREMSVMITASASRDAEYFIESFRRSGFPVSDYQPPLCYNYSSPTGAYFGSIILWKRKGAAALCQTELHALEQIRPFVTYLFFSAIDRYQRSHVVYFQAVQAAHRAFHKAGLSRREKEVFLCRFLGETISGTAGLLNISMATVRRHIRSIRKRIVDCEDLQSRTFGSPLLRRRALLLE